MENSGTMKAKLTGECCLWTRQVELMMIWSCNSYENCTLHVGDCTVIAECIYLDQDGIAHQACSRVFGLESVDDEQQ